jgi:uncharacterized ParB-like nuclease family protein
MPVQTKSPSESQQARSMQRTVQPEDIAAERGDLRRAMEETKSSQIVKPLPPGLGERIMETLMAEGYKETAAEERRMAEADMAAGLEALPD